MKSDFDLIVIGGGIVGLSTAMQVGQRIPHLSILLIEKESDLAAHQSGHNSGVVHAGIYYQPGSLKAKFCTEGLKATFAFCRQHELPIEQCGKLIVATSKLELERMQTLIEKCRANGLSPELLGRSQLEEYEPNITGLGAIHIRSTGITDYVAIAKKMAEIFKLNGGRLEMGTTVRNIQEEAAVVTIESNNRIFRSRYVMVCGGLMADQLARMCGIDLDFRIVPFRGEYFRLPPEKSTIVNHLIYPIPDPSLPFLGIHLTRMIDGSVTVGPNAVLALAREGYRWSDISIKDMYDIFQFRGFWKVMMKHRRSAVTELRNSLSRRAFLKQCHKYCPTLSIDDLQSHPAGVRAQAVLADGTLVQDFLIRKSKRIMHVCNAPSPAATSAIPIGRYLINQLVAGTDFGSNISLLDFK